MGCAPGCGRGGGGEGGGGDGGGVGGRRGYAGGCIAWKRKWGVDAGRRGSGSGGKSVCWLLWRGLPGIYWICQENVIIFGKEQIFLENERWHDSRKGTETA